MHVRGPLTRLSLTALAAITAIAPVRSSAYVPPSFARLAARFVAESEIRDPLFADGVGIHTYDDRLDDYSARGHARRITWLNAWKRRIDAATRSGLTPDDAADARALSDTIELELFEDGTIAPVHNDPSVYTSAIGEAIYALTGRQYDTPAKRFAHVAPRLAQIPSLVRAAEAMLRRPTRVATLQAIDANGGNIAMYAGLPAATQAAPPGTRAAIAARLPAALASLHDFAHFLRTTLLPRSNRNPRVGKDVYDRELSLQDGTDETRETLVADALAAFRADRAEMLRLAIPFDQRFFPKKTRDETQPNAEDVVVRRVLDRLANAHPSRNGIFAAAKGDLERTEAFLAANPVVALPSPSTLSVVPTPDFMAGFSGASFDPPGPFSPLGQSYFYIDKIPASWSAARVASYLRDFNNYELQMLSIHEAIPGHYVQFRYGSKVPSVVRRVFSNGSYVEGWAVYGEGMILDAGYRANDPAMRLFQLKWRLREETNTLIDAAFHTGDLTLARCEDLLERQAYQERSQALTKWHRIELSHDQLTSYFVGLDAIRKAQAADRERFGTAYETADFNRRLLALGGVEPRFIAPLLAR
jgi:uncharacterized protein (DUF885 family)